MAEFTKSRDITGMEIGGWIPRHRMPERTPDGEEQWACECRYCGTLKTLRKGNIQKTKSCGCLVTSKSPTDRYIGKRYGQLTGLCRTDRKDPNSGWVWEWECDCGTIIERAVKHVVNGNVKSCGCLSKRDITGQRFGRLVALYPTEKRDRQNVIGKFRCDCGKETEKPRYLVTSGSIRSCGCLAQEQSRQHLKGSFVMGTSLYRIRQEGDPLQKNNSSGHPGVTYDPTHDRWDARMEFQKKLYRRYCEDEETAVWTRQMFVRYRKAFVTWWESLTPEEQEIENARYNSKSDSTRRGSLYLAWLETHASPEELSSCPSGDCHG